MPEAFQSVEGVTCVMRGNGKTFPIRRGTIAEVTGELYADVGPLFLRLAPKADGSYEDHQGRIWDVVDIDRCQNCDGYNCDDGCAYPDPAPQPTTDVSGTPSAAVEASHE